MLMSMRARFTPTIEQSKHIGTTRITARGSDQLSYCAASTRNTRITASVKANIGGVAGLELQERQLGPLRPHGLRQLLLDELLHGFDRLARADPRGRVAG